MIHPGGTTIKQALALGNGYYVHAAAAFGWVVVSHLSNKTEHSQSGTVT
jgi:hypothetical protein